MNLNSPINLLAGKLFVEKKQKGGNEMLKKLLKTVVIKVAMEVAVLLAICIVSIAVAMGMVLYEINKRVRGCCFSKNNK